MTNVTTAGAAQARYLAEAVETATPGARLAMLWDRLVLLLTRVEQAFEETDLYAIHDNLVQAQDILLALADTLRTDTWDAAGRLVALYHYLHGELVQVNLTKDQQRLGPAADMVRQLADAWHRAIAMTSEDRVDGVA